MLDNTTNLRNDVFKDHILKLETGLKLNGKYLWIFSKNSINYKFYIHVHSTRNNVVKNALFHSCWSLQKIAFEEIQKNTHDI